MIFRGPCLFTLPEVKNLTRDVNFTDKTAFPHMKIHNNSQEVISLVQCKTIFKVSPEFPII